MSIPLANPVLADEPSGQFDGVSLGVLAGRLGTPLYVYSTSVIRSRIDALGAALAGCNAEIHYAAKANSNLAILQLMAEAGLGADIVSAGELWRCLRAGIPADRIVFSGVGKTADEISQALAAGISRFNVESSDELHLLQRIAAERGVATDASARINPDVDAHTHRKISTGKSENKFGVDFDTARQWFMEAAALTHVRLNGLHVHIGSQMLSLDPIRQALRRIAQFRHELADDGHPIRSVDVGGGLGICYHAGRDQPIDPEVYAGVIREELADFDGRILLEPGRWIVGEAGVLLTRVIRVKQGRARCFLVLDAAMNDLIRPSLYDAWHDIVPVTDRDRPVVAYDVVGPVCETGDTFASGREMPRCVAGDLVMIKSTGAYGASMASTYNSRTLAAEVLVDRGRYAVIRHRQSLEALIADEQPAQCWAKTG